MRNVKCSYCEEYRNEWCEKVKDSPHPDILRDCQYFHEAKTRWIPVTERLPDTNGPYFVTNSEAEYPPVDVTYWSARPEGPFKHGWQSYGVPIAWMPLPEPYEEDPT